MMEKLEGLDQEKDATNELSLNWWQYELLNDYQSELITVTGGYGSAKTFGSVLFTYDRLAYNPGCDALFIEPQYSLIKRVAIPAFEEVLELLGLKYGQHYKIFTSADNPRVEFCTGQKVYFLSGERPESIVGITTAAIAVIDEAGLVTQEVLQKTRARLRYKKAVKSQIFCPGTPEGLNWFSDMFDSDVQSGWETQVNPKDHIKYITTVEPNGTETVSRYRRMRATTYANAHNLTPDYIPNLLDAWKFNQNYIDSYVFGYFRPFATGLAYSNFKAALHKIPIIAPDPSKPIHLTFDYNIDPAWVSIQEQVEYQPDGHRTKYWAAIHNANSGAEQLQESLLEFMEKHPRNQFRNTPIYVYGDATSKGKRSHRNKDDDFAFIKRTLTRLGYRHVSYVGHRNNPLQRTSVDYVQASFAENRFRICENCDMVLKSVTRTVWKNNERAALDKPPKDHWTHPMDAVKYFFCALHEQSRRRLLTGRL